MMDHTESLPARARRVKTTHSRLSSRRYGKAPPVEERTVIAWDMEGMTHKPGEPQSAVVFGCSMEWEKPLVGYDLSGFQMLNEIVRVSGNHPYSINIGYGFRYDANMLMQSFPYKALERLHKDGSARIGGGWYVRYVPGKIFQVSKKGERWSHRNRRDQVSATIYDISAFFQSQKFLVAAAGILGSDITPRERDIITRGKEMRGKQNWSDIDTVVEYWGQEIQLMARVMEKFRDVMCQSGFALKQWYGPGALANFINAYFKLRPHLASVQKTTGLMPPEVHEASKHASAGGHVENYVIGSVKGPVHALDINSAYPYALSLVPSLAQNAGRWEHRTNPKRPNQRFGFYRVEYAHPDARPLELRPQPLFWRDARGLISFPNRLIGWYATPEAAMMFGYPGIRVTECWEWVPSVESYPWTFLRDMYRTRDKIGKSNPLSLPFKLGPNSLFGKYSQIVGWDKENNLPPKYHALPVAAWLTSYARAQLWRVMTQLNMSDVIAVSTDAVYFTGDRMPDVPISNELGAWSHSVYDEMIHSQSGMYHYRVGKEWMGVRSRGIYRSEFPVERVQEHLRSLQPGEKWPALRLSTERIILLGSALASSDFRKNWRVWKTVERDITIGATGKRLHIPNSCNACARGVSPADEFHRLVVNSRSDGMTMSHPRTVPWEKPFSPEVQEIRDELVREKDEVSL